MITYSRKFVDLATKKRIIIEVDENDLPISRCFDCAVPFEENDKIHVSEGEPWHEECLFVWGQPDN